jgi:lipopolysaccharide/colanic/teichoic acid biosynthesis glycosyltransferase
MHETIQTPALRKIDHYFRQNDTFVAQVAKAVSPEAGEQYRNSVVRRLMEIVLTAPTSLLALPIIAYLAIQISSADGGTPFFKHKRDDSKGSFPLWKLRVMVEGADQLRQTVKPESMLAEEDPRNTEIGAKLRKYELEELPQLLQVLMGRLRLVGLRATSDRADEIMAEKRPKTYDDWKTFFAQDKASLFSLNAAINSAIRRKNPAIRYHSDVFYAKNMSLGLDAYVIVRNLINLLDKYLTSKNG